jgi:hypothetical protein
MRAGCGRLHPFCTSAARCRFCFRTTKKGWNPQISTKRHDASQYRGSARVALTPSIPAVVQRYFDDVFLWQSFMRACRRTSQTKRRKGCGVGWIGVERTRTWGRQSAGSDKRQRKGETRGVGGDADRGRTHVEPSGGLGPHSIFGFCAL